MIPSWTVTSKSTTQRKPHPAIGTPDVVAEIFDLLRWNEYNIAICNTVHTHIPNARIDLLAWKAVPSQACLAGCARVCKMWRALAEHVLYSHPILRSEEDVSSFCSTILRYPELSAAVRTLSLLDCQINPRPRVVISLLDLLRSGGSDKKVDPADHLMKILTACPGVSGIVTLSEAWTESKFCDISRPEVFAKIGSLQELSSLEIEGASSDFSSGAFPRVLKANHGSFSKLKFLSLKAIPLVGMDSIELASLEHYSVCKTSLKMVHLSSILPQAPRLRELTLSFNHLWVPRDSPTSVKALHQLSESIEKITLRGQFEWKWFHHIDWRPFTKLRFMSIHNGFEGRSIQKPPQILLPPKLEVLVLIDFKGRRYLSRWTSAEEMISHLLKDLEDCPDWMGTCIWGALPNAVHHSLEWLNQERRWPVTVRESVMPAWPKIISKLEGSMESQSPPSYMVTCDIPSRETMQSVI